MNKTITYISFLPKSSSFLSEKYGEKTFSSPRLQNFGTFTSLVQTQLYKNEFSCLLKDGSPAKPVIIHVLMQDTQLYLGMHSSVLR